MTSSNGPSPDSFERARARFEQSVGKSLAQQFSLCTLKDVRDEVKQIQEEQGKEDRLRNMGRMSAFIEAMDQFGKVVDVFLNASEFVCFVWGPIKFLLGIAKTYVDSLDKLLDAYADIGNTIPGLLHYRATFEKHPPLATVLEDYYSDVLRFHSEAIVVFKRPRWKKLFHSTWKTFDTDFNCILHSLKRRRELLDGEKASAALYEIEMAREDINAMLTIQFEQAEINNLEKHRAQLALIKDKLQPGNHQLDQEISSEDRSRSNSGQWIFQDPEFDSWKNLETGGDRVIFINGKPGAGKTTLVSGIIEKLLAEREHTSRCELAIAYFYFKHGQDNKNTFNAMLRALLDQLIDQDLAVSKHFYDLIATMSGVNLRSTKRLEEFVKTAIEGYRACYLILDGLDECADGEALKSINWLLSLRSHQPGSMDPKTMLRIILAGQRDGALDIRLASEPSISLDSIGHVHDIQVYTEEFSSKIQKKFELTENDRQKIVSLVFKEADGMFLFARVVLDNLFRQTRLTRLKQEMQPGLFPKGLEKAYERVVARILDESSESEREDALKVLGLVACAKRVLFWKEIQAFFCINPDKSEVDYDNRLQVSCKELCGSLLDVHRPPGGPSGPEDVVQMVHETARQYLLRNRLNSDEENFKLSKFCIQYLTSPPFQMATATGTIQIHAKEGYYALHDYSVQHWFSHLRQCLDSAQTRAPGDIDALIKLARIFLLLYRVTSRFGNQFCLDDIESTAETIRTLPLDSRQLTEYFDLMVPTARIRGILEKIYHDILNSVADRPFIELQGPNAAFKCHKPWCDSFTAGFKTEEERRIHMNSHELPFRCPVDDCFAQKIGFESAEKLSNHKKNYHAHANDDVKFPAIGTKRPQTLCSAAERGDLAAALYLINRGEDINRPSKPNGGFSPLILAIKNERMEMVKLLISNGADLNFKGPKKSDRSPLEHAAYKGNLDIINLILSQDAGYPTRLEQAVTIAIEENNFDVLRILPVSGKNIFDGESILNLACRRGDYNVLSYLLQNGFDEFVTEQSLKMVITGNQDNESMHLGKVRLLLETGKARLGERIEHSILRYAMDQAYSALAEEIFSYPKLFLYWEYLSSFRQEAAEKGWVKVIMTLDSFLSLKSRATTMIETYNEAIKKSQQGNIALSVFKVRDQEEAMANFVNKFPTRIRVTKMEVERFLTLVDDALANFADWGTSEFIQEFVQFSTAQRQSQDRGSIFDMGDEMDFPLGFVDPISSTDVLNDFDFDSFLHDGNNGQEEIGRFDFGNPGLLDDDQF